jgi:S-methyl-1-thioxylulose 5-phosphate methylthiotransferase
MRGDARPRSIPFDLTRFRWEGVGEKPYKLAATDERGMSWRGVTRWALASAASIPSGFDLRYFELEPGGYSSLEKHRHVHFVVALRGRGRAVVGDAVFELEPFAAIYVAPLTPHRWLNAGAEPFGFLCTVDAERDRPQPLDDDEWESLQRNPATAPYVY